MLFRFVLTVSKRVQEFEKACTLSIYSKLLAKFISERCNVNSYQNALLS